MNKYLVVLLLSPWRLENIFSLSFSRSPTPFVFLNSSQVNFFSSIGIILVEIGPNTYVYILIFYQTLVGWASCPPYNYFITPSCYLFNFRLVIMSDFLVIFNFHPVSSSWRLWLNLQKIDIDITSCSCNEKKGLALSTKPP